MAADRLILHNARQHNLRGITVELPRRALTVVTGPSGSGKSSLAFDTLYAEGQRRYVESLSTYAKQFLERMAKPDVGRLEGLSPAVAIEQKNPTTSSRSTVGTATEIYDYLRLLWARIGRPHCHACGAAVVVDSPSSAATKVLDRFPDGDVLVGFPLPRSAHVSHELILENLQAMGFSRVGIGGGKGGPAGGQKKVKRRAKQQEPMAISRLDALPEGVRLDASEVVVVVDRIRASNDQGGRLADSLALAFAEGEGVAQAWVDADVVVFSRHPRCLACGTPAPRLTPALFSFNNPAGACPACNGFGAVLEYDEGLIVPDHERTLDDGALDPWTKPRYDGRRRILRDTARARGISTDVPWRRLKATDRRFLLHGKDKRFVGMFPFLRALERKRYKQYIRVFLRQYQKALRCPACGGARLRPEALAVQTAGASIGAVAAMTAEELVRWMDSLTLSPFERDVATTILQEIAGRVTYLCDVGLGYLTLDRQTRTLSGGEAQRIALANALGSRLTETLYVLDEPSIGLHPRDLGRLLDLLIRLRSAGNTVVVVEHDPTAMRAADFMIELGPGAGEHGGRLVYAGPVEGAAQAGTLTGDYLAGRRQIAIPAERRTAGPKWIRLEGATLHNLHALSVSIPLGVLTVVTGVSGSGKSTLVHDVLYRQLAARLRGDHGAKEHLGEPVGAVRALHGWDALHDVVLIDQSPIGRTPRSNPVTYVRAFDEIRELFADHPLARARGYTPGTFSFNAADGGRCRTCEGAGHVQVEMVFLADVFLPCEACGGRRFEPEVLDIRIKGLSIADVLELTVEEAITRFRHQERLGKALWYLQQVGLGYLRLGQPATTLSGGEAQRLKIARQLAVGGKGHRRLYILDEPTTGLHLDDVRTLLKVLDRLVDHGHTVVVIEHHLDVIKRADWVIDLGPEGGGGGGRVVAEGTPETVAATDTHTARYLRDALAAAHVAAGAPVAGVPSGR
ncbi:MAG: excinuclease ABC subunit UvrA [Gemmatimonadota bacterium]|nr:excinuclease ABC subunit UvrA [Gemmatimonadota bacterium]